MSSPPSDASAPVDELSAAQLLAGLQFLDALPADVAALVRDSFDATTYAFGDAVFEQGDAPDGYYAVLAGRARVLQQGPDGEEVALNLLGPGDSFGESAVFDGAARAATVRASSPQLVVLRLDGALLRALARHHPRLQDIFGAAARTNALADQLRTSSLFASLPRALLAPLIEAAEELELESGETLFERGQRADDVFLVREGRLGLGAGAEDIRTLTPGDVFGERALLRETPRAATAKALEPARLLRIDGRASSSSSTPTPRYELVSTRAWASPTDRETRSRASSPTSLRRLRTRPRSLRRRRPPTRTNSSRPMRWIARAGAGGGFRSSIRSTSATAAPRAWRCSVATTATTSR